VRSLIFVPLIASTISVPLPQDRDGDPFTIAVNVELVVFNVSVVDSKGHHISGLKSADFRVFDEGRPQGIRFFEAEDAPATVGLLIDNSGSMSNKRSVVHDTAMDFVMSNSRDEMFVLYFNEKVHAGLPSGTPFTNDPKRMRAIFDGIAPGGMTALYDALAAGLVQVAAGRWERRALIVFSDGGDNASGRRLDDVLKIARGASATIYAIGIYDKDDPDKNPGVLRKIAEASGGRAYFPATLRDVEKLGREISGEIRSQYTIGFLPGRSARDTTAFRNVKIDLTGRRNLSVVARKGYALPAAAGSPETP